MSREIKFRAWKKSESRMVEWRELSELALLSEVLHRTYLEAVMQFTGLLDKNGRKIYEGDIVKASWGYGEKAIDVDFECILYAKMECTISDDIEVIGNIYENPELVKE